MPPVDVTKTELTIAALEPAIKNGMIKSDDKVVAISVCSFEKYLPDIKHLILTCVYEDHGYKHNENLF